jgi:hypothetical protein
MPNRWLIVGFLLIMLTSVIAGLRQCQGMRLKDPLQLRPLNEVRQPTRAEKWPVVVKDEP